MPTYVDGFVIPVPRDKMETYRQIAEKACKIWMEHGALEYRECVGEDLEVKDLLAFTRFPAATENETVVFAWIAYC